MIGAKIHESGATPRAIKRQLPRILKQTLQDAGRFWHRRLRPKHFSESAKSEYRYRPRTRKYVAQKIKKHGHTRPLEFSGDSKVQSRLYRLTGTSKRVRVVMSIPAFNFRPAGGRINLRDEFTRISRRDQSRITQTAKRLTDKRLAEIRDTRTVVVR